MVAHLACAVEAKTGSVVFITGHDTADAGILTGQIQGGNIIAGAYAEVRLIGIALLACDLIYSIEFNPFYGDISSGASLYDWKRDSQLLYFNKGNE